MHDHFIILLLDSEDLNGQFRNQPWNYCPFFQMSIRLYVVCSVACLCLLQQFLLPASGQLTQSLGWGSAGSPGKRASANRFVGGACTTEADILEDLVAIIEVSKRYMIMVSLWHEIPMLQISPLSWQQCSKHWLVHENLFVCNTIHQPAYFLEKSGIRTCSQHCSIFRSSFSENSSSRVCHFLYSARL